MYLPQSNIIAYAFILITMVCWGSWTYVRGFCRANAPIFSILFFIAQFLTSFFFCIILGDTLTQYNQNTFSNDLIATTSGSKIICIYLGGMFCATGDFLCSAACCYLPFFIASPIYVGWILAQGTCLSFLVLISFGSVWSPLQIMFLFLGCIIALVSIFLLAYAESLPRHLPDTTSTIVKNVLHTSIDVESPIEQPPSLRASLKSVNIWIYVSCLAGVIGGLWAPLSTYATLGTDSIDNPYVLLFIYMCGQLTSLPIGLFYYGRFISPYEHSGSSIVHPSEYWTQCMLLPWIDILCGCLSGVLVATGVLFYFLGSSVISPAIAFATAACAPLVEIFIGFAFTSHLREARWAKILLLLAAVVGFISAISLIALSY